MNASQFQKLTNNYNEKSAENKCKFNRLNLQS